MMGLPGELLQDSITLVNNSIELNVFVTRPIHSCVETESRCESQFIQILLLSQQWGNNQARFGKFIVFHVFLST